MSIVWRVKEIYRYFSNHVWCLTQILRSARATLIYKLIIHFSMTIVRCFEHLWLIMAEAKTWKNMGNLSGKPGIFLTKMMLPSKKVMEIGQKMVWKTWNFDQNKKWPPCTLIKGSNYAKKWMKQSFYGN